LTGLRQGVRQLAFNARFHWAGMRLPEPAAQSLVTAFS